MTSKLLIILFLLFVWEYEAKTNHKDLSFEISAHVYSLFGQTEGSRKAFLWKGQRRMVQGEITPNCT